MSPAPEVSFLAREFTRERLEDAATGFNFQIAQTTVKYGVSFPSLQSSYTQTDPSLITLYLGRYSSPPNLIRSGGSNKVPCAILSIADVDEIGHQALRTTPSTFSGLVIISIDLYLLYPEGDIPPDADRLYCAVEEAMINTFNTPDSYQLIPPGLHYNNEISLKPSIMEYDGTVWFLPVPCIIVYRVTA